jgi:hypothetical protein
MRLNNKGHHRMYKAKILKLGSQVSNSIINSESFWSSKISLPVLPFFNQSSDWFGSDIWFMGWLCLEIGHNLYNIFRYFFKNFFGTINTNIIISKILAKCSPIKTVALINIVVYLSRTLDAFTQTAKDDYPSKE